MSSSEKLNSINLKEIANISEDEFKKQLAAWIDEHGVSKALQSKLRADLFEQFNKTNLGRQMALQHQQQTHRFILSPLILVLNTLVSEFLYAENCHFTLSVFATEVPFKNTLPDFEASGRSEMFRFADDELKDIFEAIGITSQVEKAARQLYENKQGKTQDVINKSLLYCVLKTLLEQVNGEENPKTTAKDPFDIGEAYMDGSAQRKNVCSNCASSKNKREKFEISARYFKYLNKYLDILSDRVREMSKSLIDINDNKSKISKCSKSTVDTVVLENNLKKNLDKIIENLGQLSKSKRKSKKFRDILNSIDRLSTSLEKCGSNMENLLEVTNANVLKPNEKPSENLDYSEWIRQLRSSEYGQRFMDRLELSLQKTIDRERESLEKLYEEKLENYRILMKLHYKQKLDQSGQEIRMTPSKPKEIAQKNISTNGPIETNWSPKVSEKEQYVDQIVQTAKTRLKQLEMESEKLDESFQAYLKRQYNEKNQLNEDIAKIWQNYQMHKDNLSQQPRLVESKPAYTANQKDTNKNNRNYALNILNDVNNTEFDTEIENPFLNFHPANLLKGKKVMSVPRQLNADKIIQCTLNDQLTNRAIKENGIVGQTLASNTKSTVRKKVKILSTSSDSSDDKMNEITKTNGFQKENDRVSVQIHPNERTVKNPKTLNSVKENVIVGQKLKNDNTFTDQKKTPVAPSQPQTINSRIDHVENGNLTENPKTAEKEKTVDMLENVTKKQDENWIHQNDFSEQNKQIASKTETELIDSAEPQNTPESSISPKKDLAKILEKNTKNEFGKLTDFVFASSSSDISDENQQISVGRQGGDSSPDDFWK